MYENVKKQQIGKWGQGTQIYGILRKTAVELREYLISGLTIPLAQAW